MKYIRLALAALLMPCAMAVGARQLVILHTNDTHSQIDPADDGLGGIARRAVVIDSVRQAEPFVVVADAGDIVQGTLFFNLYKGEVEERIMNLLGYDIRILGNHEFDNGVDALASVMSGAKASMLATNYDLSQSALDGRFVKAQVRDVDGRRIGFIAINLEPQGMIAEGNYDGVVYRDAIAEANRWAHMLKHDLGADAVVALTHIGYNPEKGPGDRELAAMSRDIDVIIGGHSHDLLNPADQATIRVPNADGRSVLVTQVGKAGKYVGRTTIDLDDLSTDYSLIRIDSRLDGRVRPDIAQAIAPYRRGVDSLMQVPVAKSAVVLDQKGMALLNYLSDFVADRGTQLLAAGERPVDFGIINKGGIRRGLPKGFVTEGQVMSMLPFNNHVVVIDVKGSDLADVFDVMAHSGGNGVSRQVDATYDPSTGRAVAVMINGEPLDPNRVYRVATIDYLANGGDYMAGLARHGLVANSDKVLWADLLDVLRATTVPLNPDSTNRMRPLE